MSDSDDGASRLDQILSRVSAMLGLAGALFIIITFLLYSRLRRPMNRLLFYTSLGNLFLDAFYFVGVWGIPDDGGDKALCRTQAFMIQIFSLSPSMWTTAMAINVYLIVYRKFTTLELRRLEPWYIGINYGIPFSIAFILLMVDVAHSQKNIWGPATLWCWIGSDWQWMRLAFTFGPIWVMMVVCFVLFIVTGMKIVLQTLELKRGVYGFDEPITVLQVGTPFVPPRHVVAFTEVKVTESYNRERKSDEATATVVPEDTGTTAGNRGDKPDNIQESANQSSEPQSTGQDLERCPSIQEYEKQGEAYGTSGSTTSTKRPLKSTHWYPRLSTFSRFGSGGLSFGDPRAVHAFRAAEAYAKISVLVFFSLLIIHTPAGANRVYMITHDGQPQPMLTHFHAALNPSQGILDAVIYVAMSWPQIKAIVRDMSESIDRRRERRRRRRQTAREIVG